MDTEITPGEADLGLARSLRRLEPHGIENLRPVFLLKGLTWDGRGRTVGRNGVRFAFGHADGRIDAVGWDLGALTREERAGTFDVIANLSDDPFTGGPSLTVLGMERTV